MFHIYFRFLYVSVLWRSWVIPNTRKYSFWDFVDTFLLNLFVFGRNLTLEMVSIYFSALISIFIFISPFLSVDDFVNCCVK
jgi:hypothetical protein